MNFTLIGRPGSGKGTQGKMLSNILSIPHISTGDMLRFASSKNDDIGKKLAFIMGTGQLAPDEIVLELLNRRLTEKDTLNGFILDGYPRTLEQACVLDNLLQKLGHKSVVAIEINISRDQARDRLLGRMSCPECGLMYHIKFFPSKIENKCDICHEFLVERQDDEYDVVIRRQDFYDQVTAKLVTFYNPRRALFSIDGNGTPQDVLKRIKDINGMP